MEKLKLKYISYTNALDRLEEAINIGKKDRNSILLDATIQRFEFVIELAWKMMKEYLEYQNMVGFNTPRMVVKEIYKLEIIQNGEIWLDMLNDRNLTSHTYDEETAQNIYLNIVQKYMPELKELKYNIEERIKNEE